MRRQESAFIEAMQSVLPQELSLGLDDRLPAAWPHVVLVELGGGSGSFAHHCQQALHGQTAHIIVDRLTFRSNNRYDQDMNKFLYLQGGHAPGLGRPQAVLRLTMDIAAVDWSTVVAEQMPENWRQAPRAVIAKHLCGVGSDLALDAAMHFALQASALAIAPCCHYLCQPEQWQVGKEDSFADRFTALEWQAIVHCSQWATIDPSIAAKEGERQADASAHCLRDLPRGAKRDFGLNVSSECRDSSMIT